MIAFNRPEVRNAFDTAMYQEVTAALRAADGDETVGAVVLTGRGGAFTSGQDLAEMAAIATGTAVEGAGQGFIGLLDCLTELSVPLLAAVNGVAVGLGFTLLAHCDLVLVAPTPGCACPSPSSASRPRPRAASSSRPRWAGSRRRGSCSPRTGSARTNWSRWGWRCGLRPGTVLDETVGLAARIAAHPRAAARAITSLMRAARRDAVLEANRREQGAFAGCSGAAAGSGTLADFAPKTGPDRAPRHHRRPHRPRPRAGRLGRDRRGAGLRLVLGARAHASAGP